jgi:hypothetical protein
VASPQAEDHRVEQAALVSLIARLVAHAWATLLDPHNLKGSTPRLTAAIEAIVKQYGAASAAHALSSYRSQRRAAGIVGRPALRMPQAPSHDVIEGTVENTLHSLYGPVTPETEARVQDALTSEVEQLVLHQGRDALINATQSDKEAKGWARVTEPDACSFCRLLATRGAVYKTRESGDFRAHTKKPDGSGGTCRCNVEPVFNAFEMTAQARQDLADYRNLTKTYGTAGRDILVAWRQHVEGRPVTGPLTKPYTRST